MLRPLLDCAAASGTNERAAMRTMNLAGDRWIRSTGWVFFALYVVLTGTGKALQFAVQARPFGEGPPQIDSIVNALVLGVWAFGGALLISRQPKNPIGWILCAFGLLWSVEEFVFGYAYYGTISYPGSLVGAQDMIIWYNWSGRVVAAFALSLLVGLFPTGKPLSPRWGRLLWFNAAVTVLYVVSAAIAPLPSYLTSNPFPLNLFRVPEEAFAAASLVTFAAYVLLLLCAFAFIASLFVRLARARGVERLQLKWFAFASALFIPGILFIFARMATEFTWSPLLGLIGVVLILVMLTGIAVAATIAILRYKLWNIDIIIRRTLIYGLLTGILALVYFSSVVLLQQLFRELTGQQSQLAVVLSTLGIAALFFPLRRGIQHAIDRRFYRRKYDAEKTLAHFAAVARDQIELNKLTTELLNVIHETIQPAHLSMWLKEEKSDRPRRAA
jgi:hypothetical protein